MSHINAEEMAYNNRVRDKEREVKKTIKGILKTIGVIIVILLGNALALLSVVLQLADISWVARILFGLISMAVAALDLLLLYELTVSAIAAFLVYRESRKAKPSLGRQN